MCAHLWCFKSLYKVLWQCLPLSWSLQRHYSTQSAVTNMSTHNTRAQKPDKERGEGDVERGGGRGGCGERANGGEWLVVVMMVGPRQQSILLAIMTSWDEQIGDFNAVYTCSLFVRKTMGTLLEKFLADFAVCDEWRFCKALYDVKFSKVEGNGRTFRHIELSHSVITYHQQCRQLLVHCLYCMSVSHNVFS